MRVPHRGDAHEDEDEGDGGLQGDEGQRAEEDEGHSDEDVAADGDEGRVLEAVAQLRIWIQIECFARFYSNVTSVDSH